jgi:hypothetical protein
MRTDPDTILKWLLYGLPVVLGVLVLLLIFGLRSIS